MPTPLETPLRRPGSAPAQDEVAELIIALESGVSARWRPARDRLALRLLGLAAQADAAGVTAFASALGPLAAWWHDRVAAPRAEEAARAVYALLDQARIAELRCEALRSAGEGFEPTLLEEGVLEVLFRANGLPLDRDGVLARLPAYTLRAPTRGRRQTGQPHTVGRVYQVLDDLCERGLARRVVQRRDGRAVSHFVIFEAGKGVAARAMAARQAATLSRVVATFEDTDRLFEARRLALLFARNSCQRVDATLASSVQAQIKHTVLETPALLGLTQPDVDRQSIAAEADAFASRGAAPAAA